MGSGPHPRRPGAAAGEPLFLVQYKWYGGEKKTRRMSGQRLWKIIKDLGKRVEIGLEACSIIVRRAPLGDLDAGGCSGQSSFSALISMTLRSGSST